MTVLALIVVTELAAVCLLEAIDVAVGLGIQVKTVKQVRIAVILAAT